MRVVLTILVVFCIGGCASVPRVGDTAVNVAAESTETLSYSINKLVRASVDAAVHTQRMTFYAADVTVWTAGTTAVVVADTTQWLFRWLTEVLSPNPRKLDNHKG